MSEALLIKRGSAQLLQVELARQALPVAKRQRRENDTIDSTGEHAHFDQQISNGSGLTPAQLKEIEDLKLRAVQEGREEGYAQGIAKAAKEEKLALDAQAASVKQLLQSIRLAHDEELQRLEDMAADFGFQAACRLVGEAHTSRELSKILVRQALLELPDVGAIRLELHPADAAFIDLALDELKAENPNLQVKVLPSQQVSLGGCRLHTELGVLDARLETQLAALKRYLDDARAL